MCWQQTEGARVHAVLGPGVVCKREPAGRLACVLDAVEASVACVAQLALASSVG